MSHYLYFVRHGEQTDAEFGVDDGPLSERGVQQAERVAARLASVPFTGVWHSPLQRAEETAERITGQLAELKSKPSALLMDCIPSGPDPEMPKAFDSFYGGLQAAQWEAGTAQMADAAAEWLRPSREDRHDLLITHNFVIAWFVREVLDAPQWRWLTINQANCAITVLRARTVKPNVVIAHNDVGHLPATLQTGVPAAPTY